MSEHETNQAISHPLLIAQDNGKYSISEPVSIDRLFQLVVDLLEQQFTRHDLLNNPDVTKRYLQV